MQDQHLHAVARQGVRGKRAVQPRGDDTRRRILAAALDTFATEGYEGTTTRQLADLAQVNLPAIQYYFGSKEGLYRAVVAHLVETMESRVAPAADRLNAALAVGPPTRQRALTLLCLMLDTFTVLVTDQTVPDWQSRAMFFARAEIEASTLLDPLHEWATRRIFGPCSALVGHLIDRPADAEDTLLHTLMLLGQITIFCNQKGLRALGWTKIDPERVRSIQGLVRGHTRAIFRKNQGSRP